MLVLLFLCAIHGSHGGESEEQTCLPDYDDVLFFLISPPFPFPRPYMCINSASQGYHIASSTAVTSHCYAEFFYAVAWNNNQR